MSNAALAHEDEVKVSEAAEETPAMKQKKDKGINTVTVSGLIAKSELKNSGSYEVWLNTDTSREDTKMKGTAIDSYFTSTLFIRVPKPVVDRVGVKCFEENNMLIVQSKLAGIRRIVEGQAYDFVELRAADVIPVTGDGDGVKHGVKGLNTATISGYIEHVEAKKSGSYEVWLNTDPNRRNTPIKGAGVTSFFTSTLFVRVPKPVVDRIGKDAFKKDSRLIVPSRLTGVRRITEGKPFDLVEISAVDCIHLP